MSSKKPKATRKRMISCFAQIVQEHIPIPKLPRLNPVLCTHYCFGNKWG